MLVDYRDGEGENLLGVGDRLDDVLQVLADKRLHFLLHPSCALVRCGVRRCANPQINFNERSSVVSLATELRLRWPLQ